MPHLRRQLPKWLRVLAWFAILYAIGLTFAIGLRIVFHAPFWITATACFFLGLVIPTPRWARWASS